MIKKSLEEYLESKGITKLPDIPHTSPLLCKEIDRFYRLVECGCIHAKSLNEVEREKDVSGNPQLTVIQATQRICKRNGINWKKELRAYS